MLSEKQREFIADPDSFVLKNEVDNQVNKLLYGFQQQLSALVDQNIYAFPEKIGKTGFKVNKGNNHKGFPFQVMDYPASLGQEHAFSFRSVVWYANFFSFSLILKGSPKDAFATHLDRLAGKEYTLAWSDNIWESHIHQDQTLAITQDQLDKTRSTFQEKGAIKIIKSYNLNQIDEFERLGTECFKDLFTKD